MNSTQAKSPVNHEELDAISSNREAERLAYKQGKSDRAAGVPAKTAGMSDALREAYLEGYES